MSETKTVRIGAVGISGRGSGMLDLLLQIPGVVCPAVCDKVPERAERGLPEASWQRLVWFFPA